MENSTKVHNREQTFVLDGGNIWNMQKVLRFNLGYLLELQHAQPTKFGRKNIKT